MAAGYARPRVVDPSVAINVSMMSISGVRSSADAISAFAFLRGRSDRVTNHPRSRC
jgi:hypothetical protein